MARFGHYDSLPIPSHWPVFIIVVVVVCDGGVVAVVSTHTRTHAQNTARSCANTSMQKTKTKAIFSKYQRLVQLFNFCLYTLNPL